MNIITISISHLLYNEWSTLMPKTKHAFKQIQWTYHDNRIEDLAEIFLEDQLREMDSIPKPNSDFSTSKLLVN